LFTTNVRPRRRTTIEPGRAFSPRSEFLTFIMRSLCFLSALVTTSLARSFPSGRAGPGYLRTCCCCRTLPQLWALHLVPFGRAERPCSGLTCVSRLVVAGLRRAAAGPFLRHVRAVLDQLAGAIYDRLGSRLLAGSLGGVAFEPVPVIRPGVRTRVPATGQGRKTDATDAHSGRADIPAAPAVPALTSARWPDTLRGCPAEQ
jgi:hypothetical protein